MLLQTHSFSWIKFLRMRIRVTKLLHNLDSTEFFPRQAMMVTETKLFLFSQLVNSFLAQYRTDFWTLWGKVRVGCFKGTALKHVYYLGWNRSPAQAGCMRQVLGTGALGRPRRMGWGGRRWGGSGWGTHVNPWLIHVNVWQKPLQYCKVISLQLIKINGKQKKIIQIKIKFPVKSE